jgi:DnaJ-class molecular chaperone
MYLSFNRCPKCSGKGKIIKKKCHVCTGNKIVKGLEEMTIYIEKGMTNGYEIVIICYVNL